MFPQIYIALVSSSTRFSWILRVLPNLILLFNLNCQYNLKEQMRGDGTLAVRSSCTNLMCPEKGAGLVEQKIEKKDMADNE